VQPRRPILTDEQMDIIIAALLRAGVAAASVVVFAGGIYYLARYGTHLPNYAAFHGEPPEFRTISGIVTAALALRSRGIIEIGLLLLILTPIARVVFSVIAFAIQRDRTYLVVTLIVLAVLVYNLVWGYR
jgi:uncharacterized membrane protein